MSVALSRTCIAVALVIGSSATLAEDPTELFPQLNACIDATLQKQEGVLFGWTIDTKEPPAFTIDVLAPDDKVLTMKCTDGKVGAPERKLGNKNYKMVSSRARIPEVSARFTALSNYPIAELRKMEFGLNWKGKGYYTYQMSLNDGRQASVDVNAETGQIDKSKSER
jgi:hypothetical protein